MLHYVKVHVSLFLVYYVGLLLIGRAIQMHIGNYSSCISSYIRNNIALKYITSCSHHNVYRVYVISVRSKYSSCV